jgi:hypothetical protein
MKKIMHKGMEAGGRSRLERAGGIKNGSCLFIEYERKRFLDVQASGIYSCGLVFMWARVGQAVRKTRSTA